MLEASNIIVRFGALTALHGAGLRVEKASFHGLIGPNGSGKSTLLKSIAGAVRPTEGQITLQGRDITKSSPAARFHFGLSFKFQITSVMTQLTVYDNLLLACQVRQNAWQLLLSRSRDSMNDRIDALLEQFHLAAVADLLAAELSHGQQQWLEIAMALALEPDILLLDEPTAGMSPQERRATGDLLTSIKQSCSLLIVEHDLDFIGDICDTLTVLDQGRIVATGPTGVVQNDAAVREAYLSHA